MKLYRTTLLLGAVAGAMFVLWYVPHWQTEHWRTALAPRELLELQNRLRLTLALALATAGLLGLGALLWRRAAAAEHAAERHAALETEARQADAFARAIGHLADARLEVRLGGVYQLEQLARAAPRQRAAATEVLCALVRDRGAPDEEPAGPMSRRPPGDVQAALTALGRRIVTEGTALPRLDLRRADLRGADLAGADLRGADLRAARLDSAALAGARLSGADLRGAILHRADLGGADVRGADLSDAQLQAAYLVESHLEGANLRGADLSGAYLGGAQLQGAELGGAQLAGAYLYQANLDGTALATAHLPQRR
ncbi:MAG: pentapeptide repeat-containing protein [Candidatus Binatia bacterium]